MSKSKGSNVTTLKAPLNDGKQLMRNYTMMNIAQTELKKQIVEYDRVNEINIDAAFLWQLHVQLGFGKKRLKRFFDNFEIAYNEMIVNYEASGTKNSYDISIENLKGIGVDIVEWHTEQETRLEERKNA